MQSLCAFLLVAPFVAAQFEGFGEPKFCKPYQCPKDQEPVPKWPLKLTSAGCTSVGGMQVMAPGEANADKDDPTTICCDLRNACLQTCGSLKSFCDEEYAKCSKAACPSIADEEKKAQCQKTVNLNDLMIKLDNNCQKHSQEQYKHCDCVSKSDAPAKRERILRNFYKKFSPEGLDKVPGLAAKADTTAKLVGLLLKLYQKYPAVISKIKDPQQEYMEKIMKDAKKVKMDDPPTPTTSSDEEESGTEDLGVDEL
jgi:hypothetical protein